MTIKGAHIPFGNDPVAVVSVNERDAISYYPYVQGGPVEAGYLNVEGVELAVYVNSRYGDFDEAMVNARASALFEFAGIGMLGGAIRGDALVVLPRGRGSYDRSLPSEVMAILIDNDGPEDREGDIVP